MQNGNGHSNGDLDEIREILKETAILQNQQAKVLLKHSEILAAHEEGMERLRIRIEALVEICDDLIRHKADRKKR